MKNRILGLLSVLIFAAEAGAVEQVFDLNTGKFMVAAVEELSQKDLYSACEHYKIDKNQITSVEINERVASIAEKTFSNCKCLEHLFLSTSVESIGNNAFEFCWNLKDLVIPVSVEYIGARAFQYCGLERIILTTSLAYVGKYAFAGCDSLSTVILDGNIERSGGKVFKGTHLESKIDYIGEEMGIPAGIYSVLNVNFENSN